MAARIVGAATDDAGRVEALFTWVRDNITYDMGPVLTDRVDWSASSTLARGYGFCQQKAILFAALLRSVSIPSGLGIEAIFDHKIPPHFAAYMGGRLIPLHGYTLVLLDGSWQRLDATLDTALCERKGYRVVQFVPGIDQLLPATDIHSQPHIDHIDVVGEWSDLPDDIVTATLDLPYLHDDSYRRMATKHGPGM